MQGFFPIKAFFAAVYFSVFMRVALTDTNLDKFASIQKLFCRDLLCFNSTNNLVDVSDITLPVKEPHMLHPTCCRDCTCEAKSCVEQGTCCIDALGYFPSTAEANGVISMSCEYPQFRPYKNLVMSNAGSPVKMFRRCKQNFYGDTVVLRCEHPELFTDIFSYVPVVDTNTLMSYQNRFCAQCHGVNMNDIVSWYVNISCLHDWYNPQDLFENVRDIEKTKDCNMIYMLPNVTGLTLPKCERIISTCNETGLWKSYDREIENGCLGYTTIYDFKYKNVFCYMCNTNDTSAPDFCFKEPRTRNYFTFAALLKLPQEKTEIEVKHDDTATCAYNRLYDFVQKRCRDVLCKFPKTYNGSECVESVKGFTGLLYEVFIELTPVNKSEAKVDRSVLDSSIDTAVTKLLFDKNISKSNFDLFSLSVKASVLPPQPGEVFEFKELLERAIVAFRANLDTSDIEFLKSIESIHGNVLDITTDTNKSQEFYVHLSHWYTSVETPLNLRTQEQYIPSMMFKAITNYLFTYPTETVTKFHFCPHIVFSRYDTSVEENEFGFFLVDYNLTLSFDEAFANCSTLYVCEEKLVNSLKKKRIVVTAANDSGDKTLYVVSYVCVLTSISFSFATFVTYCLLSELRTQPGINNMILVFLLMLTQSLFQFGYDRAEETSTEVCAAIGFLIHFSWLMLLMWMNVCSIHMFRVFNNTQIRMHGISVFRTSIMYLVYSVSVSFVPVLANVVTAIIRTNGKSMGYGGELCYIDIYDTDIYFLTIPAAFVILVNAVLYGIVVFRIHGSKFEMIKHSNNRNLASSYVKLSTITGITWSLGIFYMVTDLKWAEYLFVILNGTQGLFVFLGFIANKRTIQLFKRQFCVGEIYSPNTSRGGTHTTCTRYNSGSFNSNSTVQSK